MLKAGMNEWEAPPRAAALLRSHHKDRMVVTHTGSGPGFLLTPTLGS